MGFRACWRRRRRRPAAGERTELAEKGQLWGDRGRSAEGGGEGDNLGARGLGSLKTAKCDQRNSEGQWAQGSNLQKAGLGLWGRRWEHGLGAARQGRRTSPDLQGGWTPLAERGG